MSKNLCDMCWRLGDTTPYRDDSTVCDVCLEKLKKSERRGHIDGAKEYNDI